MIMSENVFSEVKVDAHTITEINAALGRVGMEMEAMAGDMSSVVARSLARTDAQNAVGMSNNGNHNGQITAFNSAI
jgi:hypothetical protein